MIQGSEEWRLARLGKVTASRMADVTAKTKTGWGASRANYMAELIAERLTGVAAEGYTNAAMQWGTDKEPEARAAYEFMTDQFVMEAEFYTHHSIVMSGASPDGLVTGGERHGLIEIKCPNTATHIDTLLSGTIPGKYILQMHWQMACVPDSTFCDFVSFDPRLPERMRLFIKQIDRDQSEISRLELIVQEFLAELDDKLADLTRLYEDAE